MPLDQPPEPPSPIAERTDDLRMTLGQHIEDLRKHLIRALMGIGVALVVTCYFGPQLIGWLAQPLLQAMEARGFPPQTYTFGPSAGFTVFLNVTLIAAAIVSGPWLVYQAWTFIVLGLHEHERKVAHALWPFSVVMTALGVLFTYYILLPVSLMFFFGFASLYPKLDSSEPGWVFKLLRGEQAQVEVAPPDTFELKLPTYDTDPETPTEGQLWINRPQRRIKVMINDELHSVAMQTETMLTPMPDMGQYVVFAAMMGLGVVIAFQLPVVMLVVGWTGLVDPKQVAKLRKYAFFACFALGALLTPTDLLSMFVLALPLYALFELGLLMMKRTFKPEGP